MDGYPLHSEDESHIQRVILYVLDHLYTSHAPAAVSRVTHQSQK